MNGLTSSILILCMFSDFLSFETYTTTLWGIKNYIAYEDVKGNVYSSFSDFESFACRKSRNEGILTVCGNILNFQISGILFQIASYTALALIFYTVYSYFKRKKTYKYLPYLPSLIYFIGSLFFLIFVSSTLLDPQDNIVSISYERGYFLLFLTNILNILTCAHYFYISLQADNEFQEFNDSNENVIQDIIPDNNIQKYLEEVFTKDPEDIKECYAKDLEKFTDKQKNVLKNWANQDLHLRKKFEDLLRILEDIKNISIGESIEKAQKAMDIVNEMIIKIKQGNDGNRDKRKYDDIETTRRYQEKEESKSRNDIGDNEMIKKNLNDKIDRITTENQEIKNEMSKIIVLAESRLEEIEKQKKILDNNKQLLVEKHQRIEELEKQRHQLENKDKNSLENVNELKKYLKEYEEILIQTKKEKDELIRSLRTKESENEVIQEQFIKLKNEALVLRSSLKPTIEPKTNINDIEIDSLNLQIAHLTENLKKSKEEISMLVQEKITIGQENENLHKKLDDSVKEYQISLNKIYGLENLIQESNEVKNKYFKALDDINEMSTMIESFKKDTGAPEEKSFFVEKCTRKKQKIKKLRREAKRNERVIEDTQKSIEDCEREIEELKKELEVAKLKENEGFKKLNMAEEEWERVKSELLHNNAQQNREIEVLQSRMRTQEDFFEKELQTTQLLLESAKDERKKFESQADFLKNECDRLLDLEKQLAQGLPKDLSALQPIIEENLHRNSINFQNFESQINKFLSEKEKLRSKLQQTENELQVVSEECQQLHKLRFETRREENLSISSAESFSHSIQDSLIIEGISPSIIFHNPLMEKLSKLRKEPPMSYSTVWKTLETMMMEKLKIDKVDIEIGRLPRNVADYMFEFMYKQYGLKALGLKQLKALTVSLEELYKVQHPYAVFFSRVMGIFHSRPIPARVSVFLFSVQDQFNNIIKKPKSKSENFSEIYETMQFGGEASIVDIVGLVKKVFSKHRPAGERVLYNLHRDRPDRLELTILKICSLLKNLGENEEYLFDAIKDSGISADYQEFIDGIRDGLNVWISQEEAEGLCSFLDENGKGEITLEAWKNKIKIDEFINKADCKAAMVTKADFLNSLVAEYEYEVLEDYHALKNVIKGSNISAEQASQYLIQIDPDMNLDIQERIFKEALVHDGGKGKEVSSEALSIVILKHNIGGYGKGVFTLEI
ncbi:hypothetical protein SteCoe_11942 [Stentor coeruleus]|uniref:EF-hand domain-containing protein n=1 Tax=Stentor coeruleus TaxID=5963 RepID=A0A1R2CC07_9CILI|nr:hypothetical protein SteCoe_11942 [Stentor coeruleus]